VCRSGAGVKILLSVARALGTTLMIFDGWANAGVTGRIFLGFGLFFCIPWVVDIRCSKALD
jgi:hypothetical protein